jgi:hypothetical protein
MEAFMTESLLETYARLKRNIAEAKAKLESEPGPMNNQKTINLLKIHTEIYYDFCATFTENIMKAMGQTIDEVRYM